MLPLCGRGPRVVWRSKMGRFAHMDPLLQALEGHSNVILTARRTFGQTSTGMAPKLVPRPTSSPSPSSAWAIDEEIRNAFFTFKEGRGIACARLWCSGHHWLNLVPVPLSPSVPRTWSSIFNETHECPLGLKLGSPDFTTCDLGDFLAFVRHMERHQRWEPIGCIVWFWRLWPRSGNFCLNLSSRWNAWFLVTSESFP